MWKYLVPCSHWFCGNPAPFGTLATPLLLQFTQIRIGVAKTT